MFYLYVNYYLQMCIHWVLVVKDILICCVVCFCISMYFQSQWVVQSYAGLCSSICNFLTFGKWWYLLFFLEYTYICINTLLQILTISYDHIYFFVYTFWFHKSQWSKCMNPLISWFFPLCVSEVQAFIRHAINSIV